MYRGKNSILYFCNNYGRRVPLNLGGVANCLSESLIICPSKLLHAPVKLQLFLSKTIAFFCRNNLNEMDLLPFRDGCRPATPRPPILCLQQPLYISYYKDTMNLEFSDRML